MKDDHKTKKQPVPELTELRSKNAVLNKSIAGSISAALAAEEALRYAESIVETVRGPLLVLDGDLKIVSANRNFYRTFQVTSGETIGSLIYDLGNKQWDIPDLRKLLEEVLPEKQAFDDFEVAHDFQDIGPKTMLLNARRIYRKDIGAKMILLAIEDITERKRLENFLAESEERFRRLFETASDGIVLLEKSEGKITHANPATEKMLGYTSKDSIGNKLPDIGVLLDKGDFQTTMQILNRSGITNYDNVPIETKSRQHIDTDIYLVDRARLVQCNIRDVTDRKQAERVDLLARKVLDILNRPEGLRDTIRNILHLIQKSLDFQAAGIRLKEGDDFPYYETSGFPEDFVRDENFLCTHDEGGKIVRASNGHSMLACVCGNVLSRRTDAALPFFTRKGSFWTNSTTDLLAATTEKERQALTPNRCNAVGYESVALIPLRTGDEIIGLLQLNDRRRDRVTLTMINFLEDLGSSIGIALTRKRAKDDLNKALAQYRSLAANVDSMYLVDRDGTYLFMNEGHLKRFGLPWEEVGGKRYSEFHSAEESRQFATEISEVCKTRQPSTKEHRSERDGRYFIRTLTPITGPGPDGTISQVSVISKDITARKLAEEEKSRNQETAERLAREMALLAEIGRVVGSSLNVDQVLERVGTEIRKLIPYDRLLVNLKKTDESEFVVAHSFGLENPGRKLGASYPREGSMTGAVLTTHKGLLVQPADAEEIRHLYPHLYATVKEGLHSAMSVPLISLDEVIGSLTFRAKKLKAYSEQDLRLAEKIGMQITGAIVNAQLFDDLHKTEKSLRENEQKYRELVEFLPIAVFETDIRGKIVAFNQTALAMFRYTAADAMRDRDGRQLFTPEERERLEQDMQERMEGASKSSAEYKFIRKDGSCFTGLMYANRIIRRGEPAGVRGAIIDITDRIKATEELRKAQEHLLHSEKLAAIGRLAAGVAHEILNPVNIVSLSLQILMKGGELSPKVSQELTICTEQLQRIVTIAEDLKRFSRVSDKNLVMGDIAAAVDHVLTLCLPQLNMTGIQTDVQHPDGLPMTLMDRERIEQVILNLIMNAIAAMEGKEEKVLRLTIGREIAAGKKDCLRVTIADTGTGIAKQDRDKIFEPFFTTKAPGQGTGLGLSISFGIIQEHGGRIWAENNAGGGTSFFFEIPITGDEGETVCKQRR